MTVQERRARKKKTIWRAGELEKPLYVASYFGFVPIEAPRVSRQDIEATRDCGRHPHYDAAEKAALIRTYLEHELYSAAHPLTLSYKKSTLRGEDDAYSLHFIGSPSGLSEAVLVRSALSILQEDGHKRLVVDINCIGDKDSLSTYERELASHARKLMPNLPEDIRERIKKDIFELLEADHQDAATWKSSIPQAIAFLSPQSRSHFKEVLEYIEALGVEFRLEPRLVGNRHYCSHTIFAVRGLTPSKGREGNDEETLAIGYRYSRLSKRLGLKKDVPMAGVTIFSKPRRQSAKRTYKNLPKSKFFLVQLGQNAKRYSLGILETLRQERICVNHYLGRDKLATQLASPESMLASHVIIIGQKEALDNTATVRDNSTRAQETIPVADLAAYLKSI